LANTGFQTVYNYKGLGLELKLTVRRNAREYIGGEAAAMPRLCIFGNLKFGEMEFGEMKLNTSNWSMLFLHAFTSRGFDIVSWAFLLSKTLTSAYLCTLSVIGLAICFSFVIL